MGDRANFVFEQENGDRIFLYGHHAGWEMMDRLANAIKAAQPRWHDESYATRIAISSLVGNAWDQEMGWGISTYLTDNEHSIPVVNWSNETVTLYDSNLDAIKFVMPLGSFVAKFDKNLAYV